MRYACRQEGCGFIPRSETDWITGQQRGTKRECRMCAACGGELAYRLGSGGTYSTGQDKPYQHVIFMQIPWSDNGETRTVCAKAMEPTVIQEAKILAVGGITFPQGANAGLINMVIEASKCFINMVGDKFPRAQKRIVRLVHVGLGELEIGGGGILSLSEKTSAR